MPKLSPNEPWLHKASGFWCKKVAGELHYLNRDYKAAKRKLTKLLRDKERQKAGDRDWLEAPFSTLCDAFHPEAQDCNHAGRPQAANHSPARFHMENVPSTRRATVGLRVCLPECLGKTLQQGQFVKIMDRARKRAGIEAKGGERVVLYSCDSPALADSGRGRDNVLERSSR